MEADMRAGIVAFVSGVALAAVSAQAAPLAPTPLAPVTYIPIQEWAPLPNDPPSFSGTFDPNSVPIPAGPRGYAMRREATNPANMAKPEPPIGKAFGDIADIPAATFQDQSPEAMGQRAYENPWLVHGDVFNPPPRETMATLGIDKTSIEPEATE
jgi:hypothetical protein